LIYFLVTIILLTLCFNSLTNITVVNRYFPDSILKPSIKILVKILGIINLILSICLLVFFSFGLLTELKKRTAREGYEFILFVVFCLLLFMIGLFTAILQLQMNNYLTKKNKDKLDSLINLIGKE